MFPRQVQKEPTLVSHFPHIKGCKPSQTSARIAKLHGTHAGCQDNHKYGINYCHVGELWVRKVLTIEAVIQSLKFEALLVGILGVLQPT